MINGIESCREVEKTKTGYPYAKSGRINRLAYVAVGCFEDLYGPDVIFKFLNRAYYIIICEASGLNHAVVECARHATINRHYCLSTSPMHKKLWPQAVNKHDC